MNMQLWPLLTDEQRAEIITISAAANLSHERGMIESGKNPATFKEENKLGR